MRGLTTSAAPFETGRNAGWAARGVPVFRAWPKNREVIEKAADFVMPGLVPGIQLHNPLRAARLACRDKPGNDKKLRFP
ncbi:hypothetical protein GCM10007874_23180 [Labrys miyagiensis]|uniref:Uncharacterized protein n=1 Tax=Labrys miyagiensis TaxID=346912 RepID=A0ABQ6CG41_9HYPH|nr:hypothetical protein GCM10007874_23180 [Labrys miyagiensis]